ncbi:MAG TPA: nuclear transport factor 2 family protein [Pyrinomonadaceae bacterium]
MSKVSGQVSIALLATCLSFGVVSVEAQRQRQTSASPSNASRAVATAAAARMTGVYRIDISRSDKLYTVVAGASSNLPFREQQRFFIDLAVRLTPPDLLAIERRGRRITIGSSRAPRFTFDADGINRSERADDGHIIHSRAMLEENSFVFTSSGRTEDNFSVTFASIDDGSRLRVTRRISAEQLNEPVVIQTVYNKISPVADWNIYGESQTASAANTITGLPPDTSDDNTVPPPERAERNEANTLRTTLDDWINATNARDIPRQMTFYMPEVKAYYLARNVSHAFVRAEKARVFARATAVDIRAEAPEIVFRDGGRTAIMRFRKRYSVVNGRRNSRGEVVQELRWSRTQEGWKIFSERDVRVIR